MTRKIHRVSRMIACNPTGKPILITQEDFSDLATSLMTDLETLDVASFKMAATKDVAMGKAKENYSTWEETFCKRLVAAIQENEFDPSYQFNGKEARIYIDDFLEAYRISFLLIDYSVGRMHEGNDEIINISLKRKQNIVNKIFRQYGKKDGEINIMRSSIHTLRGVSFNFLVEAGSSKYHFSPNSVTQVG